MLKYNVLLYERFQVPVISVALLLRPEANASNLTGTLEVAHPDDTIYLRFAYRVIRLWQEPPESILAAGVGTFPLLALTDVAAERLPALVQTVNTRVKAELPAAEAKTLWTSFYLLMGLRYPSAFADELLTGVIAMHESTTYQKILAVGVARGETQGRIAEAKALLVRQGRKRFGPP